MSQRANAIEYASGEQKFAEMVVRVVCLALLMPIGLSLLQAILFPDLAALQILLSFWMGSAALLAFLIVRSGRPRVAGTVLIVVLYGLAIFLAYNGGGVRSPGYIGLVSLTFLSVGLVGLRGAAFVVAANVLAGAALLAAEQSGLLPSQAQPNSTLFFWQTLLIQMVLATMLQWAVLRQMRRADLQRIQSEARYRALLDQAGDAIFAADAATGRIIDANLQAARLVGLPRETLRTMHQAQIHPPEERALAHLHFQQARQEPGGLTTGLAVLHADGHRIPVEIATSHVSNPDGTTVLLGIFRDVSERHRSEAELQASEERFRATFEQAAVGMCHSSVAGDFLRVNRRFCEITGYSSEELMAISFRELTHPDDLAGDEELASQLVAGALQTYSLEKRYIRKDGAIIWVNLTASPMRGPSGEVEQLLGVIEEITDRKLAEWALRQLNTTLEERVNERTLALSAANRQLQAEVDVRRQVEGALRESEARYKDLLESLQQGVVVYQDETITFCNSALSSILGYPQEYLLTNKVDQLALMLHAEDRQRVLSNSEAAITAGSISSDEPFRVQHPEDGTVRWLHTRSSIIQYGGRPALLGVINDITELKDAEEWLRQSRDELREANNELARAARHKDEFLANMSHELRTPLNAILGRAELLAEEIHGPLNPRQQRSVASIEESGRHLLELINDILDLSKIEASKLELQHELVSVSDLCEASMRMVTETASKKGLKLCSDLDPQVVIIAGDPRRLKQILVNLLANAVKFTPSGGKVGLEVRANSPAQKAVFTIWDTGIGIANSDLPRLFRPFEQLDSKLSRQYEGTGLGLSLVARLTHMHGGKVSVESEPGVGTRFTVALPWQPHEG